MKPQEMFEGNILENFWTVPNVITLSRIALIVPTFIVLFLKNPVGNLVAFILILVAYSTDFLDGYVARKTHAVSKAGMLLDPLSDKLLSAFLSLALLILGKFPLYFFILIVGRDLLILAGSVYALKRMSMIELPLALGKINTFILGIVLAFYPLDIYLRESAVSGPAGFANYVAALVKYGTWVSAGFVAVSGAAYIVKFIIQLAKGDAAEKE